MDTHRNRPVQVMKVRSRRRSDPGRSTPHPSGMTPASESAHIRRMGQVPGQHHVPYLAVADEG